MQGGIETQTENRLVDSRGRRGWDELREEHGNIYVIICKIDTWREVATQHGKLSLELYDNPGWGGGGGRKVQEGGHMCILMADSLWRYARNQQSIVKPLSSN